MAEVVTFGEIMLRLTPPGALRLGQARSLEVTYGGAEANVAVMLAQLGTRVDFVTALPDNELGEGAIRELRGRNVGVEKIVRGSGRMGVYFLEAGASQRPGGVLYDRANSVFAQTHSEAFDWPAILHGAQWLHWSGITPALSPAAARMIKEACAAAKLSGLKVSCDVNYRSLLWSPEAAGRALAPLLTQADLVVTSLEEARKLFALELNEASERPEEDAARALQGRFGIETVAMTMRAGDSAGVTSWAAMLWTAGQAFHSRRHEIAIVDRVGAGDSFTGALIFALRRGDPPPAALEFAVAASTLKHTIQGDFNLVTLAEVEALVAGGSGGRVRR